MWIGICEITSICKPRFDDAMYIKALKVKCLNYIETKFVLNKYHRIASFLNPNYKSLIFTSEAMRTKTIRETKGMLNEFSRETSLTSTSSVESSLTPSLSNVSSSSSLSNDTEKSFLSNYYNRSENDLDEIDSYVSLKWVPDSQHDLLDWWVARRNIFPQLSEMALQVHSIPASSLQSERHFSRCGVMMNDRRSRMNPNTLENLLILNQFDKCKVGSDLGSTAFIY